MSQFAFAWVCLLSVVLSVMCDNHIHIPEKNVLSWRVDDSENEYLHAF